MHNAAQADGGRGPEEVFCRRVTVVGLGRFGGGVGVTRWLCRQGARVTVSDQAPADKLARSVQALEGLDVTLHLGGHEKGDFTEADLLVVNPAVPKDMPLLAAADAAGVPRTTEINLFIERCPAPIIGVTGTVGKSTTTAMLGAILACRHETHVGGNIGRSLLEELETIRPEHVVVLELSSFQLEDLPLIGFGPHVAVVTNLAPNHLDRHGTMEAYAAAKRNICRFQGPEDVLVLNGACEATAAWRGPGRTVFFDPDAAPFDLAIPGRHNQANAQAAWTAAELLGVARAEAADVLGAFPGLPHRLRFVAERGGARYYNDSKCTTPEGAIVALEAFDPGRTVIILGGYDKGVGFDALAAVACERAKAVVALGATRDRIAAAVEACRTGDSPTVDLADSLAEAIRLAAARSEAGDAVLLSPACASYDMFNNYEQRGDRFQRIVAQLAP